MTAPSDDDMSEKSEECLSFSEESSEEEATEEEVLYLCHLVKSIKRNAKANSRKQKSTALRPMKEEDVLHSESAEERNKVYVKTIRKVNELVKSNDYKKIGGFRALPRLTNLIEEIEAIRSGNYILIE